MKNQSLNSKIQQSTEKETIKKITNQSNLKKKLYDIKKKITDCQLRGRAKIENINKQKEIEIQNIKKEQSIFFFKKIISIADNLNDLLNIANKKNIQKNHIIQGIFLTLQSLLDIFYKFNIKIENEKNIEFQSKLHESVEKIKSKNISSNHIVSVIQPGYIFNNEVLRKAKVKISD